MRRMILAPALGLLGALIWAPAASALTVSESGTTLVIADASGVKDVVTVTVAGGQYVVADSTAPVGAGVGCTGGGASVSCSGAAIVLLSADMGAGNDRLTLDSSVSVRSSLTGGSGRDRITGGAGADLIDGGSGADVLAGGGGTDTVTYQSRSKAVTVIQDGLADDGQANERDNVADDVEEIIGGSGNDTLTGGPANNILIGGPGADTMNGGDGVDLLESDLGSDVLIAGAGSDTVSFGQRTTGVRITMDGVANDGAPGDHANVDPGFVNVFGSPQDDTIVGNDLRQFLHGGSGSDTIKGLAGDDVLLGEDGDDTLLGGAGVDTLVGGNGTDVCKVGPDGGTTSTCE